MPEHAIGSLFAVATAVLWASSATCFEFAGRRIGSLSVNVLRMAVALLLLALLCKIRRGMAWPGDADAHTWLWVAASGARIFSL
ncbi:MAG: EamA family transporter [Tepidisphaeraceae bacterium]